jgi:Xaa-Pro aminopeptidase
VHYLSGLDRPPLWEFPWHIFAMVPRRGDPALMLSKLDLSAPAAEAELWIQDLYPYSRSDMINFDAASLLESEQRILDLSRALEAKFSGNVFEATARALRDRGLEGAKIGFDDTRVAARIPMEGINAFDAIEVMRDARMIKSPAEIDRMRAVAVANEEAALAAAHAIPALREWSAVVQHYGAELALRGGRMRYLLGGGPEHTGTHQHMFRDYELKRGDFIMIDALGEKGHYIGDFGRTVCWGEPRADVQRRFDAMRKGFAAGLEMVRPGVPFEEIRARVTDVVRREGFGEYSICVPHSVGMEHTDTPRGVGGFAVAENMTMNIDIAYLEAGFGSLHLEDTFVVRAHGAELLTSGRTELIVLG